MDRNSLLHVKTVMTFQKSIVNIVNITIEDDCGNDGHAECLFIRCVKVIP